MIKYKVKKKNIIKLKKAIKNINNGRQQNK